MNVCLLVFGLAVGCAAPASQEPVTAPADPWVAEDKLRHFALSFAATKLAYGGARFALDPSTAVPVAAGTAASLGLAKELHDRRTGGAFSTRDLAWNAAGVGLGIAFVRAMR